MVMTKNKSLLALLVALAFSVLCASSVWAGDEEENLDELSTEDPFEGKPPMTDQFKQFSNELALRVHQEIQQLLDKELKALRKARDENRYTVEERIAKQEMILKSDPKNADAHFALGEVYDELRDGSSAIIHTQMAEQLYAQQKNVKGLAESRRHLRWFFDKYDYEKEDFLLN